MAAPNTNPIFPYTPQMPIVGISTANTNRDGITGTYGTLFTAGTLGARIERVLAKGDGSSTSAGMVRLFVTVGSTTRLVHEFTVDSVTASASVATWEEEWVRTDGRPVLVLPASAVIKVSTHLAESFVVVAADAGDY
jgi:hypothetical protein